MFMILEVMKVFGVSPLAPKLSCCLRSQQNHLLPCTCAVSLTFLPNFSLNFPPPPMVLNSFKEKEEENFSEVVHLWTPLLCCTT